LARSLRQTQSKDLRFRTSINVRSFLRQLLVEAVQTTNRLDEGSRRQYQARCHKKPKGVAKVAAARKLTVLLYWMLKTQTGYPEIAHNESSSKVSMAGTSMPSIRLSALASHKDGMSAWKHHGLKQTAVSMVGEASARQTMM